MISQTAEYALRAVVLLGSQSRAAGDDPGDRSRLPGSGRLSVQGPAVARADRGLVEARRGLGGGYVLTRPLGQLTVYDVVQAVDPLDRIHRCPLKLSAHAERLCSLHQRLDDAVAMLESYFKETTIAALSERSDRHRSRPALRALRGQSEPDAWTLSRAGRRDRLSTARSSHLPEWQARRGRDCADRQIAAAA